MSAPIPPPAPPEGYHHPRSWMVIPLLAVVIALTVVVVGLVSNSTPSEVMTRFGSTPQERTEVGSSDVTVVAEATAAYSEPRIVPLAPQALEPIPGFPKIDRQPPPEDFNRGILGGFPPFDPTSNDPWQIDLRHSDVSELDLADRWWDLVHASFDDNTIWPEAGRMPPAFDWETIMDLGRDPGLGMRLLHDNGITGAGVGIAIIDQPLLVQHQEYADRLMLYEEINLQDRDAQMHGPAVASIAVGSTVGVAPQADLYYIGSTPGDREETGFTYNFSYYAEAIERILEINERLPPDRRIRVISISVGWSPEQAGYADITAAVDEAKAAGMLVVSAVLNDIHGFDFAGMGRDPMAPPNTFESYEPALFWAMPFYGGYTSIMDRAHLLVPMDSRTVASPDGPQSYVFYRMGGVSWSIPYIAGMYALAAQVNPAVTPDIFWDRALQTGRTIELAHLNEEIPFGAILDPVRLIAALTEE